MLQTGIVTDFRSQTRCTVVKKKRGAGHWQSLLGEVDFHQQIAGERGVFRVSGANLMEQ